MKSTLNRTGLKTLIASGVLCLFAAGAPAHHTHTTTFDLTWRETHTGILKELDWRNPHIFIFVEIETGTGQLETWSFEGPAPRYFRRDEPVGNFAGGSTGEPRSRRSDFEDSIGKTVTVESSRARDGSQSGLIREVTLANGTTVSACPQYC